MSQFSHCKCWNRYERFGRWHEHRDYHKEEETILFVSCDHAITRKDHVRGVRVMVLMHFVVGSTRTTTFSLLTYSQHLYLTRTWHYNTGTFHMMARLNLKHCYLYVTNLSLFLSLSLLLNKSLNQAISKGLEKSKHIKKIMRNTLLVQK